MANARRSFFFGTGLFADNSYRGKHHHMSEKERVARRRIQQRKRREEERTRKELTGER